MVTKQGELTLLQDSVAQELLQSRLPARLAYNWLDNTPRVVPIWFHWTGEEIVLGTPPKAPKLKALPRNPTVAISIDSDTWPYKVLQIRGTARVEMVDGITPEYQAAAKRYFGEEQGRAWIEQVKSTNARMGRIAIRPEWVAILDFETRFPSALSV
jgi:PPOX class probable F420-dependent enzyme